MQAIQCPCHRTNYVSFFKLMKHVFLLVLVVLSAQTSYCHARIFKANDNNISITSYRNEYDNGKHQQDLIHDKATDFSFERFQSPTTIKKAFKNTNRKSPFKWHQGKDGRRGYVSSTKLVGDWVLAESQQVAVKCTTQEVLQAYLSGDLQQQWNKKEVLECSFKKRTTLPSAASDETDFKKPLNLKSWGSTRTGTRGTSRSMNSFRSKHDANFGQKGGKYYQQDLVLRSQRIIRSHTGIMRYSQIITIDKIGPDSYAVLVRLDPEQQKASATTKKPFESLSVYVGLQQKGDNVDIYAAGVMQVNRKVVPNLVIFDASGIAGSMAGKGTLWLSSFFDQRRLSTK